MAYYGGHRMRALVEDEIMSDLVDRSALSAYFANAWTPQNKTLTPGIGRYSTTGYGSEPTHSDISVRDASFLKIRNIVFGYELPEQWAHAIKADRINLQFQIDNPKAIWTANDLGVDPETLGIRTRSSYIFSLNVNL
jgi:hypothetical protein